MFNIYIYIYISELEQTKFIEHDRLLNIRQDLHNDWENEYETTTLKKYINTLNALKKGHKVIKYDLNDNVVKSFSKIM